MISRNVIEADLLLSCEMGLGTDAGVAALLSLDMGKVQRAISFYSGMWYGPYSECEECHLPGDCWLCGAE